MPSGMPAAWPRHPAASQCLATSLLIGPRTPSFGTSRVAALLTSPEASRYSTPAMCTPRCRPLLPPSCSALPTAATRWCRMRSTLHWPSASMRLRRLAGRLSRLSFQLVRRRLRTPSRSRAPTPSAVASLHLVAHSMVAACLRWRSPARCSPTRQALGRLPPRSTTPHSPATVPA